ncbi:hypothetical protein N9414_00430 [Nodularia spumigena CCY9414]|nr:hypothetical protein N9414_00430 [Nodularia spumigena CCY9414]
MTSYLKVVAQNLESGIWGLGFGILNLCHESNQWLQTFLNFDFSIQNPKFKI